MRPSTCVLATACDYDTRQWLPFDQVMPSQMLRSTMEYRTINSRDVECDIVNKCKRTNPFEQSFLIKNLAVLSLFLPYQQRLTQKQNTR